MKTAILLFLALCCTLDTIAQPREERYNIHIQEAINAFAERDYLRAARAYTQAFRSGFGSENPELDHFQAAYAWASSTDPTTPPETVLVRQDSSMLELGYLITRFNFADIAKIENEAPFVSLRDHPDWALRLKQIRVNARLADPASDTVTTRILENIQRWKDEKWSLERRFGCLGSTIDDLNTVRVNDSICFAFVDSLLKSSDPINGKRLGGRGLASIIEVVKDAPMGYQARYLDKLSNAVTENGTSLQGLATLEDMISLHKTGEQIYGTLLRCDTTSRCEVLPIQAPDGVDYRRKSMGLEPLEDYIRKHGIRWNANLQEQTKKTSRPK